MTKYQALLNRLFQLYPNPKTELNYRNPWELLVATVLAAQCTDKKVNQVTPTLFAKWPGPKELASADIQELEETIRPTGFYKNKAKALKKLAEAISTNHQGKVPTTLEELTSLPGVGRKTANVVLNEAMGIRSGIPVDTHVARVSKRLGLAPDTKNPNLIEEELKKIVPQEDWGRFAMALTLHGRYVCKARRPKCESCGLSELCPKIGV